MNIRVIQAANQSYINQYHRNRRQIISLVRDSWVRGGLDQPLYKLARIDLELEEMPAAVNNPLSQLAQEITGVSKILPAGTRISTVFDNHPGGLLILGAPGSGKTTLLLELAQDLLDRADEDEVALIPIVFNLSSWPLRRLPLTQWLAEELGKTYGVPRPLAEEWIRTEQFLPLLDGLDEVTSASRQACVETIDRYREAQGLLPIVICCRVEEYRQLARLRLPGAVMVRPLTPATIDGIRGSHQDLAAILEVSTAQVIMDLFDTPLMLNTAMVAYREAPDEMQNLSQVSDTRDIRLTRLFEAYVNAMFRRRARAAPYTRNDTIRWLKLLATTMRRLDQSVFHLEYINEEWLPTQRSRVFLKVAIGVIFGLLFGVVVGLIFGLFALVLFAMAGLPPGLEGLGFFLVPGVLSGALIFGLVAGLSNSATCAELFNWSWRAAIANWRFKMAGSLLGSILANLLGAVVLAEYVVYFMSVLGLAGGMLVGLSFDRGWRSPRNVFVIKCCLAFCVVLGLALVLRFGPSYSYSLLDLLSSNLLTVLTFGSLGGLVSLIDGLVPSIPKSRAKPNQGTFRSGRNVIIIVALCGLLGSLAGLVGNSGFALAGALVGGLVGLLSGMRYGGRFFVQHWVTRSLLWCYGDVPLNYVRFLDYATSRNFLRRVGGGYIFVHRMLLDHFAESARDVA